MTLRQSSSGLHSFTLDSARAGETETMEVIHADSSFDDVMTTRI